MEDDLTQNCNDLTLWLLIISSSNEYVCHVNMQMLFTTTLQAYLMPTHEKHAYICLKQDAYVPCGRLGGGEPRGKFKLNNSTKLKPYSRRLFWYLSAGLLGYEKNRCKTFATQSL
jgi:hypothetical protein